MRWCFYRTGRPVESRLRSLGSVCCDSKVQVCIVHTFGDHSLSLQLCMLAQSKCSTGPCHSPIDTFLYHVKMCSINTNKQAAGQVKGCNITSDMLSSEAVSENEGGGRE